MYMDLKDGRVVIELLPDIAPKHVARIKKLARAGLLRRHAVPSRDRGLHGAGRRPDRHRHRRQRLPASAGRIHQHAPSSCAARAAWRAPPTRTARTASSSSCSRRRRSWTANTRSGARWSRAWSIVDQIKRGSGGQRHGERSRPDRAYARGRRREVDGVFRLTVGRRHAVHDPRALRGGGRARSSVGRARDF